MGLFDLFKKKEDLGLSADKKQSQPVRFFDPARKSDMHTAEPSLKAVFMEISASSPYQKDMLKHVKFSGNYIISDYRIISHYNPEYKRPSIVIIAKDEYEVKCGPDDDMRGPAGLRRFTDIREAMRYFVDSIDNYYKLEEVMAKIKAGMLHTEQEIPDTAKKHVSESTELIQTETAETAPDQQA